MLVIPNHVDQIRIHNTAPYVIWHCSRNKANFGLEHEHTHTYTYTHTYTHRLIHTQSHLLSRDSTRINLEKKRYGVSVLTNMKF